MLSNSTDFSQVTEDCRKALAKLKLSHADEEMFMRSVSDVLDVYRKYIGESFDIKYDVKRRSGRVQLRLVFRCEKHDLFEEGAKAEYLRKQKTINDALLSPELSVSYRYAGGYNVVTIRSARKGISNNILKQPMIQAVIGGTVAGLVCLQLPEQINSFIVDDITTPILSVLLEIMSGILGPIVFLSIVKAVSALESIEELSGLGIRVIRRFLTLTICVAAFSNIVGIIFFPLLGRGTVAFDPGTLIDLVLAVIPTSLVLPFVNNNIPQIVILAIGMGAVVLTLGERIKDLTNILSQLSAWLVGFMETIMIALPLVPFLSVFNIAAKGDISIFLRGWKYIVAIYVCMALSIGFKICKVSRKSNSGISALWRMIRPVIVNSLLPGSSSSDKEFDFEKIGIEPEFSSFWVPLSNGLLDPTVTISLVIAPFLVAEITGTPVSFSFLLVLMLLSVQLSMASPGLTAGYTVIFQSLGMSAEYVGMFSVFSVVIQNCANACRDAYRILEQIETALRTGHIDMERFNKSISEQVKEK